MGAKSNIRSIVLIGVTGALLIAILTPENLADMVWVVVAVWAAYVVHVATEEAINDSLHGAWFSWYHLSARLAPVIFAVACAIVAHCCWEVRFCDKNWNEAVSHCSFEVFKIFVVLTCIQIFDRRRVSRESN